MVSSDKNVESIVKLIDSVKKWVGLKGEMLKLDAADKGVRILSALIFIMLFLFFFFTISILLTLAIAFAISPYTGLAGALVIMAALFFIVLLLLIIMRTKWVVNPLVRFFSMLLNQ